MTAGLARSPQLLDPFLSFAGSSYRSVTVKFLGTRQSALTRTSTWVGYREMYSVSKQQLVEPPDRRFPHCSNFKTISVRITCARLRAHTRLHVSRTRAITSSLTLVYFRAQTVIIVSLIYRVNAHTRAF